MSEAPQPEPKDIDPLAEEPIPSFESFADEVAAHVRADKHFQLFRGLVGYARYAFTREILLVGMLTDKGVISKADIDEWFNDERHEQAQEEGLKAFTAAAVRLAASGKLGSKDGETINPDDALVLLNDVLDIRSKGLSGKTLETICDFNGRNLRNDYDQYVAEIVKLNEAKSKRRALRDELDREDAAIAARRAQRLRIYLSQCNIENKPQPTPEEQQAMLSGKLSIPERA